MRASLGSQILDFTSFYFRRMCVHLKPEPLKSTIEPRLPEGNKINCALFRIETLHVDDSPRAGCQLCDFLSRKTVDIEVPKISAFRGP